MGDIRYKLIKTEFFQKNFMAIASFIFNYLLFLQHVV